MVEEFGPPEVLTVKETPDPEPAPGQVLIRVHACGVNRRDAWVRAGLRHRGLPRILGCDIAGTVVAVGDGCGADLVGRMSSFTRSYPVAVATRADPGMTTCAGLLGCSEERSTAATVSLSQ